MELWVDHRISDLKPEVAQCGGGDGHQRGLGRVDAGDEVAEAALDEVGTRKRGIDVDAAQRTAAVRGREGTGRPARS